MQSLGRLAVVAALGGLLGGCTVHTVAPAPTPNVIAQRRLPTPYAIGRLVAPRDEICSRHEGLRDLCVDRFHDAFESGLNAVLSSYMPSASAADAVYTAEFQLVEFMHSPTSGMQDNGMVEVQLALRWQFVLRDRSGEAVVKAAETTTGPVRVVHVDAAEQAVGALVNATLERIGAVMNSASLSAASEGGS